MSPFASADSAAISVAAEQDLAARACQDDVAFTELYNLSCLRHFPKIPS